MRVLLPLVLLSACSEFNISGDPDLGSDAGAPSLETPVVTEKITQYPEALADILFVIDNTPTMDDDQANLFRNLPVMMDYFLQSELDFHVGVTSTNKARAGRLFAADGYLWVDPSTPDPVSTFTKMAHAIPQAAGDASDESGVATSYMAVELRKDNDNLGFLREDAGLHIIVLTDEDDQSYGNPITKVEFISYLNSLPQDPDVVTFSSIVCQRGDQCASGAAGGSVGDIYNEVTDSVGGVKWPINDNDYTDALELLATTAAGLRREFYLSQLPVPGSIEVYVKEGGHQRDGVDAASIPEGHSLEEICERRGCVDPFTFVYDARQNAVVMQEYVPEPFAKVTISYVPLAASGGTEAEEADTAAAP